MGVTAAAKPILYYTLFSPAARACLLTSKLIGLNLELKPINFDAKEHFTEWFLKLNSRHTVPVLVDKDVPIADSHAIITYLVGQYGEGQHESLYPRDLLQRAVVDERLYFENGILFTHIKNFSEKIFRGSDITFDRRITTLCQHSYGHLEGFLAHHDYMAGDQLTLADISINTSLITLRKIVPLDNKHYPKVDLWLNRMSRELPDYKEVNEKGAQLLYERFQNGLEDNMTRKT